MATHSSIPLRTVLGDYPHTLPLKRGDIRSEFVTLDFADIRPTHRAFKPMIREAKFDLCEMAIVTYLQAKALGKPLVLLPATMLGRFQQGCMLYNSSRGTLTPRDLPGCRVGVRSYAQTTGVWLRGILRRDYGVDLDRVQWITFEDAHVAEYSDPPGVVRAPGGKDLTAMLLAGELDAAVFGAELPNNPELKSVIAEPEAAARDWYQQYRVTPINHMVVVKQELVSQSPQVVREAYRLLVEAKRMAAPTRVEPDPVPFGIAASRPALELIIDYTFAQRLIGQRLTVDELFDGVTDLVEGLPDR